MVFNLQALYKYVTCCSCSFNQQSSKRPSAQRPFNQRPDLSMTVGRSRNHQTSALEDWTTCPCKRKHSQWFGLQSQPFHSALSRKGCVNVKLAKQTQHMQRPCPMELACLQHYSMLSCHHGHQEIMESCRIKNKLCMLFFL